MNPQQQQEQQYYNIGDGSNMSYHPTALPLYDSNINNSTRRQTIVDDQYINHNISLCDNPNFYYNYHYNSNARHYEDEDLRFKDRDQADNYINSISYSTHHVYPPGVLPVRNTSYPPQYYSSPTPSTSSSSSTSGNRKHFWRNILESVLDVGVPEPFSQYHHSTNKSSDSPQKRKERINILCLDGGGLRGLIQLELLKEIQRLCHGRPIHEVFDMVVGTSAGSLLAGLVLQRNGVDAAERIYEQLSTQIFGKKSIRSLVSMVKDEEKGRYNSAVYREMIERTFGNSPLLDPSDPDPKLKVVILASELNPSTDLYETVLFRNYESKYKDRGVDFPNVTISEALTASTAAPFYLDIVMINGARFVGGGVVSNNPTLQALMEARAVYGYDQKFNIVNLGTGQKKMSTSERISSKIKEQREEIYQVLTKKKNHGMKKGVSLSVSRLLTVCMDCDRITEDVNKYIESSTEPGQVNYIRLSPPWLGNVSLATHDPVKLNLLVSETQRYIRKQQYDIRRICRSLEENS